MGTLGWIVGISAASFLLGTLAVFLVIAALPVDYFTASPRDRIAHSPYPVMRWALRIGKNLLGLVLVVVGIVMSVPGIPGPGFAGVFIGLMLLDFPGKRRLLRSIARKPRVNRFLNGVRDKFGKPHLAIPVK